VVSIGTLKDIVTNAYDRLYAADKISAGAKYFLQVIHLLFDKEYPELHKQLFDAESYEELATQAQAVPVSSAFVMHALQFCPSEIEQEVQRLLQVATHSLFAFRENPPIQEHRPFDPFIALFLQVKQFVKELQVIQEVGHREHPPLSGA